MRGSKYRHFELMVKRSRTLDCHAELAKQATLRIFVWYLRDHSAGVSHTTCVVTCLLDARLIAGGGGDMAGSGNGGGAAAV